ncbi:helix-turn-helix domain-containing protein, partial [Streptomyces sp. NPDC127051]|uniref:helix-turn-helix domain-containing protein n=1 Tax=Streptomyces sp. NPDC127051 TaxID=3347119 RepID=UPI0036686B5D
MTRPMPTQREAAAACGVSRSTIRRREAGDLPGCMEDPARGRTIPVDALPAAGFHLHAPSPADPAAEAPASPTAPADDGGQDPAALRAEPDRIRVEHAFAPAEARFGQKPAEAEVEHLRVQLAERGERIADLQRAVAALTPAPERAALAPAPGGRPCPASPRPNQPPPRPPRQTARAGGGGAAGPDPGYGGGRHPES